MRYQKPKQVDVLKVIEQNREAAAKKAQAQAKAFSVNKSDDTSTAEKQALKTAARDDLKRNQLLKVSYDKPVPDVLRMTMDEWRSFWHRGFTKIATINDHLADLMITVAGRPYQSYKTQELMDVPSTAQVVIYQGFICSMMGRYLYDLKKAVVFWQTYSKESKPLMVARDDYEAVAEYAAQLKRERHDKGMNDHEQ